MDVLHALPELLKTVRLEGAEITRFGVETWRRLWDFGNCGSITSSDCEWLEIAGARNQSAA
jgi:hypothetical protein